MKSIQQMKVTLAETFRLWPTNAEQHIRNTVRLVFSTVNERRSFCTFEPCDKVMAAKVPRRQTHVQAAIARREKVRSEETANTTSIDLMSDSDSNTGDDVATFVAGVDSEVDSSTSGADVDISITTPRSHYRTTFHPIRHHKANQTSCIGNTSKYDTSAAS